MSEAHPMSSMLVICVFFAAAASSITMAATTPMLETTTEEGECKWNRTGIRNKTDQSCYLFVSEEMAFYEANKSCVDEGAYLVSIDNSVENALVHRLSSINLPWIGLYRPTNESCLRGSCINWMWLDGSDPGYYNWADDFYANPSQCVFMNKDGTWEHSRPCPRENSFVCEKPIPLTTTPEPTTRAVTSEMTDTSLSNSATWGNIGSTPFTFGSNVRPGVQGKKKTSDSTGDKMPIIIGCVVGGLALVVIVTVVAVVLLKRHRTSRPNDQPVEVKDEDPPKVAKHVRYNPAYEDVETNVAFKPSSGNTDTGAPGNTDTGAHGVGDNLHNIYSEAIKKQDRPGSEGILVKENTLYGTGK